MIHFDIKYDDYDISFYPPGELGRGLCLSWQPWCLHPGPHCLILEASWPRDETYNPLSRRVTSECKRWYLGQSQNIIILSRGELLQMFRLLLGQSDNPLSRRVTSETGLRRMRPSLESVNKPWCLFLHIIHFNFLVISDKETDLKIVFCL